jgi:hypothetical protein
MALLAALLLEKCIIFHAASLLRRARECALICGIYLFCVCVMLSLGLFLSFSQAQTNKRRERNEEHKFAQLADCS